MRILPIVRRRCDLRHEPITAASLPSETKKNGALNYNTLFRGRRDVDGHDATDDGRNATSLTRLHSDARKRRATATANRDLSAERTARDRREVRSARASNLRELARSDSLLVRVR